MKKRGVKRPRTWRKSAKVRRTKRDCLNALGMKKAVVLGGRRAVTVRQETPIVATMMNPTTRMDQPKLNVELLSIFDKAMGKMTPPMEEPAMASPRAAARFLSKYWVTAAMAGNWRRPVEMPTRTPWASMNCQYSLQRLVIIRAKT